MKNLLNLVYLSIVLCFASVVGSTVGANFAVTSSIVIAGALLINASGVRLGARTGFDISEITSQLGAYFKKYESVIWTKIFTGLEFEQYMRKVPGITDEYVTTMSSNTEVLQPFQKAFTPKGSVAFVPRLNKVRQIKIDYLLDNMDDLYRSYLAFMADETKLRTEWPLVKYIWTMHLIPAMQEEINTLSAKGIYVAPTPGTAGDSIDSVDGILTIISNEITDTNLTAITTGAITGSNAVDKFELFNDSMDNKYRDMSGIIFTSKTIAQLYARDYRNTFGLTNDQSAKNNLKIDASNKQIIGLSCFEGSQRLLFTPANNLLCMYDKIYTPNNLDVQLFNRDVKLLGDFKRGYGFGNLEEVFVNDQD